MSEAPVTLRLTEFRVDGLFGEFNHRIPFSVNERITALIGPNGMGKTACLKLINALFRQNWSVFVSIEFGQIEFRFNDDSIIIVERLKETESDTDISDTLGIQFTTKRPKMAESEPWIPRAYEDSPVRGRSIEEYIPFLTRVSPKVWIHDQTRQTLTFQEIIENYGEHIPEAFKRSISEQPSAALRDICAQIDCHLIETQRLLVFASDEYRRLGGGQSPASPSHVKLRSSKISSLANLQSTRPPRNLLIDPSRSVSYSKTPLSPPMT